MNEWKWGRMEMGEFQVTLNGRLDINNCIDICYALKYEYAGLQGGNQCFCDDYYPAVQAQWEDCNIKCEGEPIYSKCGGIRRVSVFSSTYGKRNPDCQRREYSHEVIYD